MLSKWSEKNRATSHAFIRAGAVVTKDVPDYALVLGVPGEIAGWVCKCGMKLMFSTDGKARCRLCKTEYELKDSQVKEVNKFL